MRMKYTIIERPANTHQQPLSGEQIRTVCERAFGRGTDPEEVQELDGGEYNNTYRITFAESQQVILRVSPAPSGPFTGRGKGLMRNEHFFQPFLAPIAILMPKTLLVAKAADPAATRADWRAGRAKPLAAPADCAVERASDHAARAALQRQPQ
jgi:hypothetical protein